MTDLPNDWLALTALVFALGLKHGFDPDHLATIDGLTRYNAAGNPRLARFAGALFSLGHGTVVVVIALVVSTLTQRWQAPAWLEDTGVWISIGFLAALGTVNLRAVLVTHPTHVVRPIGLKGRWLGALARSAHPGLIALVGALFALSFDTVSQAALFALTAGQFGGWQHALVLGLLFMLGMLVTDGINGLWISRLIRRADQVAVFASRVMALAVSGISFVVAAYGALKYFDPAIEAWSEGKELLLGAAVVVVVAGSFLFATLLVRGSPVANANTP